MIGFLYGLILLLGAILKIRMMILLKTGWKFSLLLVLVFSFSLLLVLVFSLGIGGVKAQFNYSFPLTNTTKPVELIFGGGTMLTANGDID